MSAEQLFSQCLYYALDRAVREGGHIVLRKSEHWPVMHVAHIANDGTATHFIPPGELKQPWHSVFGFHGSVEPFEFIEAERMSPAGVMASIVIVCVLGGWWALKRWFKEKFHAED